MQVSRSGARMSSILIQLHELIIEKRENKIRKEKSNMGKSIKDEEAKIEFSI